MFRPHARTVGPDGREWEIYAYRLRLPRRAPPDPGLGVGVPTVYGEALVGVLDAVLYILGWIPRLLVRAFVDLPAAAVRALGSDEWTIEAVSWAPFPLRYRWTTPSESRGQVLAQVEGSLARGETPQPRRAVPLARE